MRRLSQPCERCQRIRKGVRRGEEKRRSPPRGKEGCGGAGMREGNFEGIGGGSLVPGVKTQGPRGLGLGQRNQLATSSDERGLGEALGIPGVRRCPCRRSNKHDACQWWLSLAHGSRRLLMCHVLKKSTRSNGRLSCLPHGLENLADKVVFTRANCKKGKRKPG